MEDLTKSMQIQATVFSSVFYGFSLESFWFPKVKFFGNQINEIGKHTYFLGLHFAILISIFILQCKVASEVRYG